MARQGRHHRIPDFHALTFQTWVLFFLPIVIAGSLDSTSKPNALQAFFIFGDSTVDTGNQNFIPSVVRSNYPPYGRDLVPPEPTGRFCNGKLANDYIAEYLGLPSPPNSLDPATRGTKLLKGVNFASSGSGYLNNTGIIFGVITLQEQVRRFVKVQSEISRIIGRAKAAQLTAGSLYLVSTGSNDFINSYNVNPILQRRFTVPQYRNLVLSSISAIITELYQAGARYIAINSLGPLGCAPQQALYFGDGRCAQRVNAPVLAFNTGLQLLLQKLRSSLPGVHLLYSNVYDIIYDAVQDPAAYGFKYGPTACCGLGANGGGGPCSSLANVCRKADQYIFWDLFHPSQAMYKLIADGAISGPKTSIYPTNLRDLLQGRT